MRRNSRVVVSFIISLVLLVCVLHFMSIPVDRILPPPLLYKNCTATTTGEVTGMFDSPYADHVMAGMDTWHMVQYKYRAIRHYSGPDGSIKTVINPTIYNGTVRVSEVVAPNVKVGQYIKVVYDPYNPAISGVPDTLGLWSTNTGWVNPYLWWYLGLIVGTYLIQEIIRLATRTSDEI